MHMQAHGITMAVESLYCSHPSSVATATLLDLESLFAEIDDKVVRTTDYSGVLQACTRTFFHASVEYPSLYSPLALSAGDYERINQVRPWHLKSSAFVIFFVVPLFPCSPSCLHLLDHQPYLHHAASD